MKESCTDVLVIGAGIAGLRAGIEVQKKGASATLVSKGKPNSFYKLSKTRGIQVPLNEKDEKEFFEQIMAVGLGETDPKLAQILVSEARSSYEELCSLGVKFLPQRVEGCFSSTPRAYVIPDLDNLYESMAQKTLEDMMIIELLSNNGNVCGAVGINKTGEYTKFNAKSIVIAAGGGGGIFNDTLTVPSISGSSYVLAKNAGANVKNLEFFQMMIGVREDLAAGSTKPGQADPDFFLKDKFLLSPKIQDTKGRDLLASYYDKASLQKAFQERSHHFPFSTRDSSSFIDIAIARAAERHKATINVDKKEYNVAPFAHASNGGIVINERCETNIKGLYACGEAATGMHGADRIGGAMLTSCLVFGKRSGRFAAEHALKTKLSESKFNPKAPDDAAGLGLGEIQNFTNTIKDLMTSKAMVIRDESEIAQAIPIAKLVKDVLDKKSFRYRSCMWKYYELKSMIDYALMLLNQIMNRKESKGPHNFTKLK